MQQQQQQQQGSQYEAGLFANAEQGQMQACMLMGMT
jgi:hypothetical protein